MTNEGENSECVLPGKRTGWPRNLLWLSVKKESRLVFFTLPGNCQLTFRSQTHIQNTWPALTFNGLGSSSAGSGDIRDWSNTRHGSQFILQEPDYRQDSCDALEEGISRRAWTVSPTLTSPLSSKMWWGKQSLSCGTPSFLQASRKFSTFLRHFAILSLGTAGDGTWMLATDRGLIWLARWHRTTPSMSAAPISSGKLTFNRDSRLLRSCLICSLSSRRCSIFLLMVNPGSTVL